MCWICSCLTVAAYLLRLVSLCNKNDFLLISLDFLNRKVIFAGADLAADDARLRYEILRRFPKRCAHQGGYLDKIMDFVSRTMSFVSKMMSFVFKMMVFCIQKVGIEGTEAILHLEDHQVTDDVLYRISLQK